MNRRFFLSTLAALPVVGRWFTRPVEAKPVLAPVEMVACGTTEYVFGGEVCRFCGKPGHREQYEIFEPNHARGLLTIRYCETYYPKRTLEFYRRK